MDEHSEFYIAIQGVLKSWTALQLAVSHGFGGPHSTEKAQWMVGVIENYFKENDELEDWEVEEFISQIMSEEFDTVLEDGSPSSIAKEICLLYNLWSQKKLTKLRARCKNLPQANLADCVSQGAEDEPMSTLDEEKALSSLALTSTATDSTSNRSDCEMPSTSSRQVVDEDGWTTVVTRSKSKRKS